MKLSALTASKGTLSIHYLGFALLAPICALLGVGLAPNINWFHAGLLCIALYITYSIAHAVHDYGHADSSYKTLSRKGLKILAVVLAMISAGFIVYFILAISLWILAFAAVIPLVVLYRKGLVYSPLCFSGGLAVCVLGGYFVMAETLSLQSILLALFIFIFATAGIKMYKVDEWGGVQGKEYEGVLTWLGLLVLSLLPLMVALLI